MYIVIFNPTQKNYGLLSTEDGNIAGFDKLETAIIEADLAKSKDKSLRKYSIFKECIYIKH